MIHNDHIYSVAVTPVQHEILDDPQKYEIREMILVIRPLALILLSKVTTKSIHVILYTSSIRLTLGERNTDNAVFIFS